MKVAWIQQDSISAMLYILRVLLLVFEIGRDMQKRYTALYKEGTAWPRVTIITFFGSHRMYKNPRVVLKLNCRTWGSHSGSYEWLVLGMPSIATIFLFLILLFTSLHVSASTGHPQVKIYTVVLKAITPATDPFLGYTVHYFKLCHVIYTIIKSFKSWL
jgi:hypothetical protein